MTNNDSINGNSTAAAAPRTGRRLAAALCASGLALLCAAGLWLAAGARAANQCRDSGFGIADAVEMTGGGCRIIVTAQNDRRLRSDPLPTRDGPLSAAAVVVAGAAALPPYLLLVRARRRP
ncbi:hypothetical protein AB0I77_18920 [Streptomyces sp. NPDC050619]|uniref:hypothetical protein n=1 Tax=Streptomyces sp. NPDC050619 TaxID=3157214 RepID=UPI0034261B8A